MNTYGLTGRSVERLLSLRRLADVSKEQYLNSIKQFLTYSSQDADAMVSNAKKHPKTFERQFITFLEKKEKESSPATAHLIRNSVKKLLDVNGVAGINWLNIDDHISEKKRFGEDRAPTTDEIRRMVNASDLRMKCIILFLCSSGARTGAIPLLKWRDVAEVKSEGFEFAKVTIYRGEREQYDTFITPEAYEQLLEYRRYRENIGEKVTPQSPVFVTLSNIDKFRPERVRALASDTVKLLLARLQKQLGLRQVLTEGTSARRFEFKQGHGFRKFFKTRTEIAGVNRLAIEMMMGHNIGVQASYNKPSESDMAKEYGKAIDELTIVKPQAIVTPNMMLATFNRQFLINSGYTEEQLSSMGDLSQLTPQQMQELLKQKQMQSLGLNGNHQKVVTMSEVEGWITQGWDFITSLPDGKAVVRLPNSFQG